MTYTEKLPREGGRGETPPSPPLALKEERLASGAAWLTRRWAELTDVENAAFRRAVDLWARLHDEAGGANRASCALGAGGPCKADAFILCSWCCREEGKRWAAKRAQQAALLF